jgi:uncharacterized protein (TIGR00730 family)
MRVCVFASSSSKINHAYGVAATRLGCLLAEAGIEVVFGGGGIGLMGKLADAMLENGGKITGVIPEFMRDEGWGHLGIVDMILTPDMGERKKKMFAMSDAVIALPGGIGTLEELTEAITLKQLSLFQGPIVILNTNDFYRHLTEFLEKMISQNFMRLEHKRIWEVVNTPEEVISALNRGDDEKPDWRKIARI